ncbi:MAG: hypothetical protein ABI416_04730 [Ginsengibacter sp.]
MEKKVRVGNNKGIRPLYAKNKIQCYRDGDRQVYTATVHCVQLKQTVLAAFVYYGDKNKPEIIIGTDIEMDAMTLRYYGLRFQVAFLIRDAKQYAGLEDAPARGSKITYLF